jgi:hypothetical protein
MEKKNDDKIICFCSLTKYFMNSLPILKTSKILSTMQNLRSLSWLDQLNLHLSSQYLLEKTQKAVIVECKKIMI